jgi:hypothetical protein
MLLFYNEKKHIKINSDRSTFIISMSSKINTVEDYRRRLIELARKWPRNLSTQKIMRQEGIRNFGMTTLPGNALVQDIVFQAFEFVEEYNIDTEELLSIIQEQIVEYAKYYNYDELLSDKVEYAVTSYLEQKNRSVCETTTTASY